MKNIKWSSILTSLLYIAAGVYLFLYPSTGAPMITEIIGMGAIAVGALRIVSYMIMNIRSVLFRNDFTEGILLILAGVYVLYSKQAVIPLVPYIMSLVILISGLAKLQDSLDCFRIGAGHSTLYVILSIISIGIGAVTMFNLIQDSRILTTVYAVGLIYSGATDLFSSIYLSARIHRLFADQQRQQEENERIQREQEQEKIISAEVSKRVAAELSRLEQMKEQAAAALQGSPKEAPAEPHTVPAAAAPARETSLKKRFLDLFKPTSSEAEEPDKVPEAAAAETVPSAAQAEPALKETETAVPAEAPVAAAEETPVPEPVKSEPAGMPELVPAEEPAPAAPESTAVRPQEGSAETTAPKDDSGQELPL